MNFQPLYDRILVKRIEDETVSKGGIIIPDSSKEKPIEGLVISIGNGKLQKDGKFQSLLIKKGDKILFTKWGGNEVKINNKEYLIMKESEVLGIFKDILCHVLNFISRIVCF